MFFSFSPSAHLPFSSSFIQLVRWVSSYDPGPAQGFSLFSTVACVLVRLWVSETSWLSFGAPRTPKTWFTKKFKLLLEKQRFVNEKENVNVTSLLSLMERGWIALKRAENQGVNWEGCVTDLQKPSYGWNMVGNSSNFLSQQGTLRHFIMVIHQTALRALYHFFPLVIMETSNRAVLWSLNDYQCSWIFEKSGRQLHLKWTSKAVEVFGQGPRFELLFMLITS